MLLNIEDKKLKEKFQTSQVILARKQPKNVLRILHKVAFTSSPIEGSPPGVTGCKRTNCKLCKMYLVIPGTQFTTANNSTWNLMRHVSCHSKNVIYYLSCSFCNGKTTYIGQTTNLRNRMNDHISKCRHGFSDCIWSKQVYNCGDNKHKIEPYFKINIFMVLNNEEKLEYYEDRLFKLGHAVVK